jgi:hypothetical protein
MKRIQIMRQAVRDRTMQLRRDSATLTLATALVGASLYGLYSYVGSKTIDPDFEAAAAARIADEQRLEALARRKGTILFVTFGQYCEEHSFDNATGHTVGIDYVNCDERLKRESNARAEGAKAKNMKGMLASFNK